MKLFPKPVIGNLVWKKKIVRKLPQELFLLKMKDVQKSRMSLEALVTNYGRTSRISKDYKKYHLVYVPLC